MIQFLADNWPAISALIFSVLTFLAGVAKGKRSERSKPKPQPPAAALLLLGGLMAASCNATWADAARDTVDGISVATRLSWARYVAETERRCHPLVSECAETYSRLGECRLHTECMAKLRITGRAVQAVHEMVALTRQTLDSAEERPEDDTLRRRAEDVWRLLIRRADEANRLLPAAGGADP